MSSIRARVLLAVLGMAMLTALGVGSLTYRSVRAETEALFDYQLRQMALSLRDQGEVAPAQASALVDQQLDFVVQVWTADGRAIYASRAHAALPQRAQLGLADVRVAGQVWRSFSVAMASRYHSLNVSAARSSSGLFQKSRQSSLTAQAFAVLSLVFAASLRNRVTHLEGTFSDP